MTSAAQPDRIDGLTAGTELGTDNAAEQEADAQPEFTGDMPDDPEAAVHHQPGADGPGGRADEGQDR